MTDDHFLLRALDRVLRVAAAAAVCFLLFSILPAIHARAKQAIRAEVGELKRPEIEFRPEQRKPERRATPRPASRAVEARAGSGARGRGMDFKFTPDLGVGGAGVAVTEQQVEAMVFEEGQTDEPATPLTTPMPPYPPRARQEEIQGTVLVELVVDRQGRVSQVTVRSLPDPVFRSTVMNTIKQWRFRPARNKGVPVNMRLRVPIEFKLDE